jgi:hypothetical protein
MMKSKKPMEYSSVHLLLLHRLFLIVRFFIVSHRDNPVGVVSDEVARLYYEMVVD